MIEKKTNISIQSIFFGFAGKKSSIPNINCTLITPGGRGRNELECKSNRKGRILVSNT